MVNKSPKRRMRFRTKVLLFFGGIVAAIGGFYLWQPWEFDFIPRRLPDPNPAVDPDSKSLFAKGTRVTVITAHPDDSEFYTGALLTKLHRSGAVLSQIIVTDGDKQYYPFEDYLANRRTRRAEALKAARSWGAKQLIFLGFPDGRLRNSVALRRSLAYQIRRLAPEYILALDGGYPPRFCHQDHRRTGEAVENIVRSARSARWLVRFSTMAPNYVVDVTPEWEDQKRLIRIHKSQFFGDRLDSVEDMVEGWATADGKRIGVRFGTGLRCTPLKAAE